VQHDVEKYKFKTHKYKNLSSELAKQIETLKYEIVVWTRDGENVDELKH